MVRPCAAATEAKTDRTQELRLVTKEDLRGSHQEGEAQ